MLPKLALPFLCLFIGLVNAQYNGNQDPYYTASQNNGQYGNQGVNRGTGSGSFGYYNNNDQGQTYNNNNQQGLGQGYNNGNDGQGYKGVGRGNNDQGYHQDGYAGLGRSQQEYSALGRSNANDYQNKMKRELQKRSLGQGNQHQGLGQQPGVGNGNNGLGQQPAFGQGNQPQALGQQPGIGKGNNGLGQQPTFGQTNNGIGQGGLGQHVGQHNQPGIGLGQGKRFKRYVEREPYRKSCNSYYGKYICYRIYENAAQIPHEFTCWSNVIGQKNCTETENVLYLDRRNVQMDQNEIGHPIDERRPSNWDSSRRDQHRSRDDEFGAVEKNLHNHRYNDRELPRDQGRQV